jgi:hypothetical protein
MPRTFDSQRLRLERSIDQRLTNEHRAMARNAGALVLLAARQSTGGERTVPNTRQGRATLKDSIWSQVVKPYYVGSGDNPFRDADPQSPYARLLYDGISGAVRIQAERQAALLNRAIRDEAVVQWLTGPRPLQIVIEQRGIYDPFHLWVDPNGYRLSDRVWRASIDVRSRIDRLLDYEISRGTSAVRIAEMLEDFLTPGARLIRTNTPYGKEGSFAARRLARTEITAAAGRATVNASTANPFVAGVQWVLSNSHRGVDQCDQNARGGPNGDGIYPADQVPPYPNHPGELCHLSPVPLGSTAGLVEQLRADIRANSPRARRLQGAFNPNWLTQAILSGLLVDLIERITDFEPDPIAV